MIKRFPVFLVFVLNGLMLTAQNNTAYNVSNIKDSLKINANAVYRDEWTVFTLESQSLTRLKVHEVITVLNKNGDNEASFRQHYDKFSKLTNFKCNIYDAEGKLTKKLKSSDLQDLSGSYGSPYFDDIRYKYYKPLISVYPFTIEYDYEKEYSGSYYFPSWYAFNGYNVSIERAGLEVVVPATYKLHYKQVNYNDAPKTIQKGGNISYSWMAENVKALESEPSTDDIDHYVKAVYTAPSVFELGGYPGTMDTWKDYADWYVRLNSGRDELSENTVEMVKNMVKDLPDDRQKVKALYAYLQKKTRYFNIAFGLGGLQPMDAKVVDEVGYSDCKGLSNYMKALLKAAGIKSIYALVASGDDYTQIRDDFPSHQFNHAMLCVPLKEDTIWLECTSQNIPFGFLGDFTSDRKVLLIKEEGGQLARTPVYKINQNFQETVAHVDLTPDGNAKAEISRKFGGLQFDDNMENLLQDPDDQKDWLYNYFSIPNYKVIHNEFKQNRSDIPESVLKVSIDINTYASSSGKRIFLPVNLSNRSTYIPSKVKNRWSNFERLEPYIDVDSVEFKLPEGLDIEYLPENTVIETPFGKYSSSVSYSGNTIRYFRQVEMYKGIFPREKYNDLMKFYRDISNADKIQAVLLKKEG